MSPFFSASGRGRPCFVTVTFSEVLYFFYHVLLLYLLKPLDTYFRYCENQNAEEFVMMKHKQKPMEVQYRNAVIIAFGLFTSRSFYINKVLKGAFRNKEHAKE